ncbi:MAG: hypothetical protein JSW62_04420 [Thermoplasmatales archaeon]|jgi:hypothetical protein|nr:MAG: hypothetical protein JSW62_04420 [Thermoplasmatales archaeon]
MVFQILDDKKDCIGYYADGELIYSNLPISASCTWSYSEHLFGKQIDYGYLWTNGKSMKAACPEHLQTRLKAHESRIKGHFKSFRTSKINMEDVCFYDLVPKKQLMHYFQVKNEICDWIFENYEKPANYSYLLDTYITCQEISKQEVKINLHKLYNYAKTDAKAKHLLTWMQSNPNPVVNYDIFGSVTGRLATKTGSFPIMNLKNEIKDIVEPKLDCFVEFDFNAAEIRTMISLMGQDQPQEDIHEWNIKNIFKEDLSRAEAKQKFFAWLYNSENKTIDSKFYSKDALVEKFYCEEQKEIRNPFGRRTACDRFHALNYLLQSASSDNCLDRVNKIERFLRDRKSYVAFTIHDCVIIDLHRDDRHLIPQLKQIFEDTKLGSFRSGCKIGKDLKNMRDFKWT